MFDKTNKSIDPIPMLQGNIFKSKIIFRPYLDYVDIYL